MLHASNYSLVLLIQLSLLWFDLFVNSFSELLRTEPAVQLVLFIMQDICILFNLIIILLMLLNTYVFQVGLVAILLERFRALLMLSALYLTFSIILHSWLMNLRWLNTNRFVWTDGLQVLFVFQRSASVLYYYFYKRTSEYLGDPRLYEDSPLAERNVGSVPTVICRGIHKEHTEPQASLKLHCKIITHE